MSIAKKMSFSFNPDWHYTREEIDEMVELAEKDKIKEKLNELKDFVNKDVRMANEFYLTREDEKKLLSQLAKRIKSKKSDVFKQLEKEGLVNEDGKLTEPWSGKKGVKFIQIMLNHLLNKSLKIDGFFGSETLQALLQFQIDSKFYKDLG
jgi:hypothetical protein